ncbi:MAG: hypothetical protein JSR80_07485, partial [Verrucomicrobia bacterium]|nr:hypothetical protein [Verrucomicrobiota bacterium]
MNKILLSLFLYLFLPLMAEQEIVIHLATDATLEPVYVAPWTQDARRGSIDADLARKLHEVLCFDFNYNGHNEVLPHTPERKEQARAERFSAPPDVKRWKEMGARYLLRGHLSGNTLFIKAFHIGQTQEIGVYQVELDGNLSEDRKQLHQLADRLHKTLYGTEGIASTRLLYTLKKKGGNDEKPKSEIWISDYDGGNPLQITYEDDFAIQP